MITIGQPILFSTDTGDAWLLEETHTSFAIEWKGHYRIERPTFVYADRDTAGSLPFSATQRKARSSGLI
jgi:hypothetical protein